MKVAASVAALAGVALAAPGALEKRASLNYVQNYNGNQANFQYNLGAGTYTCSWNNPGDFVVGLGWTTGAPRNIAFSGTYNTNSGSYYAVYGWLNNPLTEYYVVESYSYDPCSNGGQQVGSLTSDGSSYKICTHTQVNQPSIVGTSTFGQYFSVRQNKRTSGTVTMANHFNAWSQHGFQPGNYNYQVMAVEAFGGSGNANVQVSEATGGTTTTTTNNGGGTTTKTTTTTPGGSTPTGGSCSPRFGQCGGQNWNGPTCCQAPAVCNNYGQYYSQCL